MTSKLYAPTIEGTIPAFTGTTIVVPFAMNRAVSKSSVSAMVLKMKTIRSEDYIGIAYTNDEDYPGSWTSDGTVANDSATFNISGFISKLNLGQSYKIQLAYMDNYGLIGYYSTLGVIKWTAEGDVSIKGMEEDKTNSGAKQYTGVYDFSLEPTEKEYSYEFILTDAGGNILEDSGELLHNCINDDISSSIDEYTTKYNLESSETAFIQYKVITVNNLIISSPKYRLIGDLTAKPSIETNLIAELNYDNGYINVVMDGTKSTNGSFLISRKDLDGDGVWKDIYTFVLQGQRPCDNPYKDFTVEQGHNYIYSLQQYNSNGIYSDRILSDEVEADFDAMFLYDGTRQLKIAFNPKVTSFKTDLLESKQETIGSKYPFIFRNGNVSYKEFPISGLISYISDNDELFMTNDELNLSNDFKHRGDTPNTGSALKRPRTTNLVGYNISSERAFKLAVLDWLNNGKLKLFRSPGEGNYIVRLLNSSLSPNDTLGRMLHTFSSTAYEMAEFNFENLNNCGFISNDSDKTVTAHLLKTVLLSDKYDSTTTEYPNYVELLPSGVTVTGVSLNDLLSSTPIQIIAGSSTNDPETVYIGSTGSYTINDVGDIVSIKIPNNSLQYGGTITIAYDEETNGDSGSEFSLISKIDSYDCPVRQFFGPQTENIVSQIETIDRSIVKFMDLLFELLPVRDVYTAKDIEEGGSIELSDFFWDAGGTDVVEALPRYQVYRINKANESLISHEHDVEIEDLVNGIKKDGYHAGELYYIDADKSSYFDLQGAYIIVNDDGYKVISEDDYDTNIYFNTSGMENGIDLSDTESYELFDNIGDVDSIYLGNGTMLTAAYILRTVEYDFDGEVAEKKEKYEYILSQFNAVFGAEGVTDELIKAIKEDLDGAYLKYIEALEEAIKEYKESLGVE